MGMVVVPLSMVIHEVYIKGLSIFESENDAPVTGDRDGIMSGPISF
jgi:hypothetical protein